MLFCTKIAVCSPTFILVVKMPSFQMSLGRWILAISGFGSSYFSV
uniref:Uncharacterized protein n=1 Tax=Rhizophora mucronata TaxID=61149 RepID=A0A2P2J6X4_RHIMU